MSEKSVVVSKEGYKALKGSIKKWKKIVLEKGTDKGIENCPLCQEFYDNECFGCPIDSDTNESQCGFDTYTEWCNSYSRTREGEGCIPTQGETRDKAIVAAHNMYTYLVDLKKRCVVK